MKVEEDAAWEETVAVVVVAVESVDVVEVDLMKSSTEAAVR